eukprot:jgi/Chlat1/6386/Chrsp44S05759
MATAESAAALAMGDDAAFLQLMEGLLASSNETRGAAEAAYNACRDKAPEALAARLLAILRGGAQFKTELRALSAVLLRRALTKEQGNVPALWPRLQASARAAVKLGLLDSVRDEAEPSIARKVYDAVAELAAVVLEDEEDTQRWPELLPFLFTCAQGPTDRQREAALLIFANLAAYAAPSLEQHVPSLHAALQSGLQSPALRTAAIRCATTLVLALEDPMQLRDLLPAILAALAATLNSRDEASAQEALESLVDVAGQEPQFFKRQAAETIGAMLSIGEATTLEEGTRQLAVEMVVTLAEARDKAPGLVRRQQGAVARLFECLMGLLTNVEDDESWHAADDESADDESPGFQVGQEGLDRLAMALGGSAVLPVAAAVLPKFLGSPQWQHRHAALLALAQIAEGCSRIMTQQLGAVVGWVLASFSDPHPRVRWAAINAIGQLCTDLGPDLQQSQHAQVLPALLHAMEDTGAPRVQAHAAAALVNFAENCPAELVVPYLDAIINRLLSLLSSGPRLVQEGALTALASVADCAQAQFRAYYDAVMPFLVNILVHATDKAHRMLRAKSLECISLVGMAVGKDKFRDDAKRVMEVLVSLQDSNLDPDDPTSSYMLQAWARLCKCLGQEFLPYMGIVMPPLLRSAQLKPDVTITEAEDVEDDEEDDAVETITIGDKRIGIRTSVLEEKATACSMLCCYADELQEGFFPFVDQVAPIMVPLLKFYFHEEVRKAAVSCMPELLRSSKRAIEKGVDGGRGPPYLKQLSDYILPALTEALEKEPETEICANMLEALAEVVQLVGPIIDAPQVAAMCRQLQATLEDSARRRADLAKRRHAEGFDEEEAEMLKDEAELENEVLEQVGECIGSLVKALKSSFLPYFDELLPMVAPLLQTSCTPNERRIAICILDDVIEFGSDNQATLKYLQQFMPVLMEGSTDDHPDVRQASIIAASVYGLGVCAQFSGQHIGPYCNEILMRLNAVVSRPDARSGANEMATDNAVSAVGKICQYQRDATDVSKVIPAWLAYLPLRGDKVEAQLVHEQLTSMVEQQDAQLLGPSMQHLPRIVSIFAEVLAAGTELASDKVVARMVALLRQLQQTLPPDAMAAAWSSLSQQQQATLTQCLSNSHPPGG